MSCKDVLQTDVEITVPANFGGENGTFQVPDDGCLVIECISAEAFMPQGQKALFGIITTAGGVCAGAPLLRYERRRRLR
jgi:hypothetical protein